MSDPRPLGGRTLTRPYLGLLTVVAVGLALIGWRFLAGLGPTTALNDGYPWGLWIAFDVVTGTALACGGYAIAILCYLLNKGRYHPLVRPAVLTSALGYTIAGISVILDLGRYWSVYNLFLPWKWNLHSVLLEVALCITCYVVVLWIELAPVFLDKWGKSPRTGLRRLAGVTSGRLEKALPWILAAGLLLPTMHQSSLGSLMLVSGGKLHEFWHTGWLPLLFLMSCAAMGYAAVTIESLLGTLFFGAKPETKMLRALGRMMAWLMVAFLALRIADLAISGKLGLIAADLPGAFFLAEVTLFVLAIAMILKRPRAGAGGLFAAACVMALAGGLYRFDVFLVAFDPGPGWSYFPSVVETLVTLSLVSAEIAVYIAVVKRFPVLAGSAPKLQGA